MAENLEDAMGDEKPITAAAVKALRERTGLPLMDCKRALTESGGDEDAAVQWLREHGKAVASKRTDRETTFGHFGQYFDGQVGAMVELKCESAPVAENDDFIELANALAQQLATGAGAADAESLLDQPSPAKPGSTLREHKDDLFNRIREVFNVGRMERLEGRSGGYVHTGANVHGVLVQADGGEAAHLKDISMHIAALSPAALSKEELDPQLIEKERTILREASLREGKPESIVDKMVEGRLRNFYAEQVLLEQPFVKDEKLTVGQFAEQNGVKLNKFIHWRLGG